MPPPTENLKCEKSRSLNFVLVSRRLNNVFTAVITVNFFFCNTLIKEFRSLGFAISTFSEPNLRNVRQLTVNEKIWNKVNAVITISFPCFICGSIQFETC